MPTPIRIDSPGYSAPPAPADKLTALVESGDLNGLRAHLDTVFWEGRAERPGWPHLKIALLREDRPMLRLLHLWGAAPTDEEMTKFSAVVREKYPGYLKALRAAGLRPQNGAWETLRPAEREISRAEVEKRAYEIYLENGSLPDRDVRNWLQAEFNLRDRRAEEEKEYAEEAARLNKTIAKWNVAH